MKEILKRVQNDELFIMDRGFKDIKVIAWDMDTTLYKAVPELSIAFMNGCIEEVSRIKNVTFGEAEKIFKEERAKTDSTTQAMVNLRCGDFRSLWEIEKKINKEKYLKKDPRLPLLFSKLSLYRHFIISNSVREGIHVILRTIGLEEKYFEGLISSEDFNEPKPSLKPFKYLLKLTGLPPKQHVYIGDRDKVDIEPAKKLGMKTILVWGKSEIADLSLKTVYEVEKVLT